jgi:PAS domain S-box-containing protein
MNLSAQKKTIPKRRAGAKTVRAASADRLLEQAFENSIQPNLLYTVSHGEILKVNRAACKLLGYSNKGLLTKTTHNIFDIKEVNFKKLHKKGLPKGQYQGIISVIRKNGKRLLCEITSATFLGDHNIKKAIVTLADMSESIQKQKDIDNAKEKIVNADISLAKSWSDSTLHRLGYLEGKLDKEITINEQWEEKLNLEGRMKENQIAEAVTDARDLERSDIGKELHDNVNQLLGVSRLYMTMAQRDDENREMYLDRSSEYTLTAIEEIRKLTKGLTANAIKDFGLTKAIDNICKDTMEANPIKISRRVDILIEDRMDNKFKLAVFRIVQEQFNNILKHSGATKASLRLSQTKDILLLVISDDGSGFDTGEKRKGIGMTNIQTRAEHYHGNARFVSKPGKGCVLTVSFAFPAPN